MIEKLTLIRDTLKQLDVRGFASMDKLVGCVIALNDIISELEENDGRQDNRRA